MSDECTQPKGSRIRGIANTTGTACHLNSALIVIGHALGPVATALVDGAPSSSDDESSKFIRELGYFLRCLKTSGDSQSRDYERIATPLDPTELYKTLRKSAGLEAEDLGDAVAALIKLLQRVMVSNNGAQRLLEAILYSGRTHSVLTGERNNSERRTKQLKERRLANPFPLPLPRDDESINNRSLHSALQQAFCDEQIVHEYKWHPTTATDHNGKPNSKWTTYKRMHVTAFPPIFMLHLQRFELSNTATARRNLVPINGGKGVGIPATLDFTDYLSPTITTSEAAPAPTEASRANRQFQLMGDFACERPCRRRRGKWALRSRSPD